jgi:hypothetical protein
MKGIIDIKIYKEKEIVMNNMNRYGGSFVVKLSDALRAADALNTIKIKQAFPEYWKQYLEW